MVIDSDWVLDLGLDLGLLVLDFDLVFDFELVFDLAVDWGFFVLVFDFDLVVA